MSSVSGDFITTFLAGFLTNIWVAAAALVLGAMLGGPLAWLRHRSHRVGRGAAALTALLRASPTFVVMFFLLNVMPQEVTVLGLSLTIPGAVILVLALAIYAAAYVSDNLLDTLRYLDAGSISSAFLFVPKMLRAFFVLVMASSVGAAIGVQEAVTITLRETDRLPTVGGRIAVVIGVILFFACVMQIAQTCARRLTRYLTAAHAAHPVAADGVSDLHDEPPSFFLAHNVIHLVTHYGAVVMLIFVLIGVAGFIAPLPPTHITIETGPVSGSWFQTAEKYRDLLEARGITVKLRPRDDSTSIIEDVNQDDSDANIGFVIQSVNSRQVPNVTVLGSIEYQPLFVIVRPSAGQEPTPAGLRGMRIAFPPRASTTTEAALPVLRAFGVTASNSQFSFQPLADQVKALTSGDADAAFIMLGADHPLIAELARRKDLRIMNFPQATAVAQQIPTLRSVVVPAATYDLAANVPPTDLNLVAGTTQVIARKDLHPGIVYMMMEAMTEVHRAATTVAHDGEFPALRNSQLPVNESAREYYQSGVPWVYKNLPIWLASVIGYYIVLIVPVFVVMPLYNWLCLPQLDEVLAYLRSSVWLRTLRELETDLLEGRPFTHSHQATLRFIHASLEHSDRSGDCLKVVERIRERLARTQTPVLAHTELAESHGEVREVAET